MLINLEQVWDLFQMWEHIRAHNSMLYRFADSYMHVKLLAWLGNLFVVIQGVSHNDDIVQEALSCCQFLMACRFFWGVCIIKQSVTFLALQIFMGVSMLWDINNLPWLADLQSWTCTRWQPGSDIVMGDWAALPNDIMYDIMNRMESPSLVSMRQVCKGWQGVCAMYQGEIESSVDQAYLAAICR